MCNWKWCTFRGKITPPLNREIPKSELIVDQETIEAFKKIMTWKKNEVSSVIWNQ